MGVKQRNSLVTYFGSTPQDSKKDQASTSKRKVKQPFKPRGKPDDYYNVLRVEKTAKKRQVRRSYENLLTRLENDSTPDTEKLIELQEAFRALGNSYERKLYDEMGKDGYKGFKKKLDAYARFLKNGITVEKISKAGFTKRKKMWLSTDGKYLSVAARVYREQLDGEMHKMPFKAVNIALEDVLHVQTGVRSDSMSPMIAITALTKNSDSIIIHTGDYLLNVRIFGGERDYVYGLINALVAHARHELKPDSLQET